MDDTSTIEQRHHSRLEWLTGFCFRRSVPAPICLALMLLSAAQGADTFYVWKDSPQNGPGTGWSNAWRHIQMAVDVAAPGDTVLVTNGVYDTQGLVTPNHALNNRVCITKAITVRSVNGPGGTFIVGNGPLGNSAVRCVYMSSGTLDGFTLINGYTMVSGDSTYDQAGGGLFIGSGGSITNCIVVDCSAYGDGGGAFFNHGGTMNDCVVSNCVADAYGGGVYIESSGTLNDCTIVDNEVSGSRATYGSGGGVSCFEGGTLNNCVIAGNRSIKDASYTGFAGGVYFTRGGTLNNCTIRDNTAGLDAGGFYMSSGGLLNDCTIYGNSAAQLGGGGGLNGGSVKNCIIRNNQAYSGGGVRIILNGSVVGSLIYDNTATGSGGGALFYNGGTLKNSTVTGNSAGISGGGFKGDSGTVLDCIVYGNTPSDRSGSGYTIGYSCSPGLSGNGNTGDDPGFVNAAGDNFRLGPTSPCINAGTNESWMTSAKDLDGRLRIIAETVDMGAYEYTAPHVTITTTTRTVSPTTTRIKLSGFNDSYSTGTMLCTNETTGGPAGTFAANGTWTTPYIGLAYGPNVLTVIVTNSQGYAASDSITVTRTMVAPGNALDFDGGDDYVVVPDNDSFDLTDTYTLECWFKADSFASSGGLRGLVTKYQTTASHGWILRLKGSELDFDEGSTSGLNLQTDRWYHVAAVNSGGTRTLYVNGNSVSLSTTSPYTVEANTDPVRIGSDYSGRFFDGQIDEVRIWNVARSEAEIRDAMHKEMTGSEGGLVAYYQMNQSAGTIAADLTSNGFDGTLMNGPVWTNGTIPCAVSTAERHNLRGAWSSQVDSLTCSILRMTNASMSGADHRVFGHDNAALSANSSDIPSSLAWRLARAWKIEGKGALTADIVFDCGEISGLIGSTARLRLVSDIDGVFANATSVPGTYSAGLFTVSGQSIPAAGYYTLGEQAVRTITATAGAQGSISSAGAVEVTHGDSVGFTITPSNYWHVADVVTNGASVGAVTQFAWSNVVADGTIHADFAADLATEGTPHWWLDEHGLTDGGTYTFDEAEQRVMGPHNFTAGEEYIADTDPNDPEDYFRIIAVSNGPPVTVSFQPGSAERVYTMRTTDDLISGVWTNVPGTAPRPGIGGIDSMQDTNPPPQRSFYVIQVEMP